MNLLKFYTDPYIKSEIEAAPDRIGTPMEDALFSPGPQERPDTCAIRVQQHILSMYGIEKSEAELVQDATMYKEYSPSDFSGTSMEDTGNLLERNGLEINRYTDATMAHLISELGQGHKILAGVDVYELMADTWPKQIAQSLHDVVSQDSNHAILVVDVDPHTMDVIIVDPLDGNLHAVSASQFMNAWKDSDCFMVSTAQSPDEYFKNAEHEITDTLHSDTDEGEIAMTNSNDKYFELGTNEADNTFEPSFGRTIYDPNGLNDPMLSPDHPDNRLTPAEYRFSHPSHYPSFGSSEAARNDSFEPSFGTSEAARNDSFAPSFGTSEAARNDSFEPSFGTSEAARNDSFVLSFGTSEAARNDSFELSFGTSEAARNDSFAPSFGTSEAARNDSFAPSFGTSEAARGDGMTGLAGTEPDDSGSYDIAITDVDIVGDNVILGLDITDDGIADVYAVGLDLDDNGSADAVAFDLNLDGALDGFVLDIDGDGSLDAIALDVTGDGIPDDVYSLDDLTSLI